MHDECECEHVYHGAHAKVRGQTFGDSFLLPPFMWVLGTKLRPQGLCRKSLSSAPSHYLSFLLIRERQARKGRKEGSGQGEGWRE